MRHARALAAERRSSAAADEKARNAKRNKLEREVANPTDAIASGALRDSPALATRLKEAEAELKSLAEPERPKAQVVELLPRAETADHKMMAELPRKFSREPDAARTMMRRVFRRIELPPTADGGLEAELEVSPAQLLTLVGVSSRANENTRGSGGPIWQLLATLPRQKRRHRG